MADVYLFFIFQTKEFFPVKVIVSDGILDPVSLFHAVWKLARFVLETFLR